MLKFSSADRPGRDGAPSPHVWDTFAQHSRRWFLRSSLGSCLATAAGCGLLIHPERCGQPRGGRLDWSIVMLDGLGLLFFFVPGLIAFIVDFATGTIYLPPERTLGAVPEKAGGALTKVALPGDQVTREEIEKAVSAHAGRPVVLEEGHYQTERLASVQQFWPTLRRLTGGLS